MNIKLLVNVSSKAWSLGILAAMGQGTPGRQASLLMATGAGRSAFAPSMQNLLNLELAQRRAGHGHPLRPEFELTEEGSNVAGFASLVLGATGCPSETTLLRKAWTLPVLAVLAEEDGFGEMRRRLAPITDRALSQALQALEHAGWVERNVDVSARPPRPYYLTKGVGTLISEIWLRSKD